MSSSGISRPWRDFRHLAADEPPQDALGEVAPVIYQELRRLAHCHLQSERVNHTLQSTALVDGAFMRLIGSRPSQLQNRAHFVAIVSRLMRQNLVQYARSRQASKRDGGLRIALEEIAELLSVRHERAQLGPSLQRAAAPSTGARRAGACPISRRGLRVGCAATRGAGLAAVDRRRTQSRVFRIAAAAQFSASGDAFSATGLSEGQLFAERFRLIRNLAKAAGQVWLAEQTAPVRAEPSP